MYEMYRGAHMWTVTGYEVLRLKIVPGGNEFTAFVDALIRAQCYGVFPDGHIDTNVRTNVQDGGVDTKVDTGIANDNLGWLTQKSIWQYKATDYSRITNPDLRREVSKNFSRQCIEQGYAYRLAICDDLPADKKTEWETILTDAVRAINPDAPAPRVVASSDLAAWHPVFQR